MTLAASQQNQPISGDALVAYQRQVLLGSIAAMVAHEFNNLMTPVLVRSQDALLRETPESLRKAADVAARNTEHAIAICRRLLEVAQGDQPQVQQYPVRTALDNVGLTLARPLSKDGLTYSEEIAEGLTVRADPILFEQVILNLLLNAKAATQPTRGSIRVQAVQQGDLSAIRVIDSGSGIEAERMRTVIQPFLAAEPQHDPRSWVGVGLGLHACRWIAHQHQARIEAAGNESGGCTFTLFWPTR